MVTKYATCAQTGEKALDDITYVRASNPELTTTSNQHNVLSPNHNAISESSNANKEH